MLLLSFIAIAFVLAWLRFDETPLLVIGHPTSTGLMQSHKEALFFNELRQRSGLPFQVAYKPLDSIGLMDDHQLTALKEGAFDLASLRFLQNSEIEPSLQGIDLVGINSDYETARQVVDAYSSTVDDYLQSRFGTKLLGVWSLGPQEIFCRQPIRHLQDLRDRKVRIGSGSLSAFIAELGGTPVVMRFEDTHDSLAIGLIDCAVSSAASANFAGWPEHATYYFPLAVHFGLNGYAISLKKWQAMSPKEKTALQQTFDSYIEELWAYSREIHRDAASCNIGQKCHLNKPYRMKLVSPSSSDIAFLRSVMKNRALAEWGERCDAVHTDCYAVWQEKVGYILDRSNSEN